MNRLLTYDSKGCKNNHKDKQDICLKTQQIIKYNIMQNVLNKTKESNNL